MRKPLIQLQNINKSFGCIKAVNGLSFEVYEGEIFGILGLNGAGKSTTLAIITGLVKPDSGDVTIFGYNLKKNFIKAVENLGVLVETPGFYDYLTGYGNLKLFNRFRKVDKKKIEAALEQVGLIEHASRKVKGYSLGMRRRLGLANALLSNPKILILDEPTNGLDQKAVKMILDLIRELSEREKISVLISSNLLQDIEAICDRVLLLDRGEKLFCESVSDLVKPIKNSFTIKVTPTNEAFSFLKKISRVKKVDLIDSNLIKVMLSNISSGELNKFLIENGYNVLEITPVKKTLQDLFLESK